MKNRWTPSFRLFAFGAALAALFGAAPPAGAALECDYSATVPLEMELGSTETYTVDVFRDSTTGRSSVQAASSDSTVVTVVRSVQTFANGSDQVTFTFTPKGLGTATVTLTGTSGSELGETLSFAVSVTSGSVLSLAYDATFPCNMVVGEEQDFVASVVGNNTQTKTIRASSSDSSVVSLSSSSKSMPAGTDNVTFTLVANAEGTATVTVYISGDASSAKSFPVNVSADPNASKITVFPEELRFVEGAGITNFTIRLGSKVTANKTLDLVVSPAAYAANLSIPASVVVPAGSNFRTVSVNGLDGGFDFSVTISDPAGEFEDGVLQGAVQNADPTIQGIVDPDNPSVLPALEGAPTEFRIGASDVAADQPTLEYHWSISDSTAAVVTNRMYVDGQIVTVYATDKDGGRSETAYFQIALQAASKITFTDKGAPTAIVDVGGNGGATFVINPLTTGKDDADNPWSAAGNDFKASSGTSVQAIPAAGTYPFGWWFDVSLLTQSDSPVDLFIPNPNTDPIDIKTPDSGRATVRYFSSNPYKDYFSENDGLDPHVSIDDFGDFDQDGLSDKWEAYYLDGGKDSVTHTMNDWGTLAVTQARGLYGSSGTQYSGGTFYNEQDTPDNDRVPTSRYEEIDNAWASDPYLDTANDAVNKVRAFLYPLTGNYIDYGTYVGSEEVSFETANGRVFGSESSRRTTSSKPFFSNILEFRGLQQTSSAISADIEKAPNWVAWGYPGILSRTNLNVRGNCPGTDPTVADTDGDGREDGWEYYFWSTILYENKPQYWRAYDPTLLYYPTLAPGGSTDFKGTGIPLLRQPLDTYEVTNGVHAAVAETNVTFDVAFADWDAFQTTWTVTNYSFSTETAVVGGGTVYAGGLFVRYPEEEFDVELIRSECYYGNPVLEKSTRPEGSVNYLTNAPIAFTTYYDDGQDPEKDAPHAAVEFTIGNLLVYTREGYVDAQGRAKLFYTPYKDENYNDPNLSDFWNVAPPTKLEPGEIPGAYVDYRTGYFYLPGYDYYPPQIQALIGDRKAKARARYRKMNGLFPKDWLLNLFDPNDKLAPNVADPDFAAILRPLGLSAAGWNPASDLDGDGLSDFEEYYLGTNPIHWDTDNDGLPDGWEVIYGLDPHDASDAGQNPDCDRMFASGPYRHADVFLYDYFNETYWNGQQSLGFVPGAASSASLVQDLPFTSREEFYVQKWMMGKAGRMLIFLDCVYPSQWLDGQGKSVLSLNPRNDDTNEDHIPDGWALYAGYIPASGIDLIDHVWGPLHSFLPPICPDPLRPDPDGDGLTWVQEYQNWMMFTNRAAQIRSEVYVAEEQDSYHEESWFTPPADWTHKTRPTSPWISDTDGDGVPDASEYREGDYDWNGDGSTLVNLDPTTADTHFDRMPDGWRFMTGLYDTVNDQWGDVEDPFGPYGDPDMDGLPN